MSYQYTEEDTETWILLFLYKNPSKTIEDIVENGCHKMILKVPFDDLVRVLDKMTESGLIGKSTAPHLLCFKSKRYTQVKKLNSHTTTRFNFRASPGCNRKNQIIMRY